jgi:phosphatidylglycerol:prolipoprotein diacylglycerol transferase
MTFLNSYIPGPVAFEVFGISIMWYGILIGAGILFAAVIIYKRAPKHEIKSDKTLDILIVCLLAGVVGARAYYILFNWSQYSGDFAKIINLRLGGLAIHGGLIFGFLAALILCRLWKMRPLNVFDLFVPGIALAQSVGRWGNYFNSEAHGGPTELPWGIPINGQMVHPTFLYESIWCFILFLVLIFIDNRRIFEGQTFLCYGALYSLGRFFIEGLRTDSLMIGIFKQAQVLSVFVFIVCLVAFIVLGKAARRKGKIFYQN